MALVAALFLAFPVPGAWASPLPVPQCPSPCIAADGEAFIGESSTGADAYAPDWMPPTGGSDSATLTERRFVPTCSDNSADDNRLLCGLALEACPEDGQVRFWVYERTRNISSGEVTAWDRRDIPPYVCLAPDDPVLDPAVAIPAMIEREFKRVVVLKGVAQVSPRPDTLVNIPTRFSTAAPASYEIALTLLGQPVVITAKAERYVWHFGDGASAGTSEAGGRVEHEYLSTGTRQAHVVIEWSGTYRIGGGPVRPSR
jgi:hypothetical protein